MIYGNKDLSIVQYDLVSKFTGDDDDDDDDDDYANSF